MNYSDSVLIEYVSLFFITTILVYIGVAMLRYRKVNYWGRRIMLLSIMGFIVCCLVAIRDRYYLSVQASFNEGMLSGLFPLNSIQSNLCSMGGAVIAFAIITSIFIKSRKYRRNMFFLLSVTVIIKTLIIEISRWMV